MRGSILLDAKADLIVYGMAETTILEVAARLADEPRNGRPATFTAEQICVIMAIACETPRDSGYQMTHWTQQSIADEAMRRDVVDGISQRSVGRFLKRI